MRGDCIRRADVTIEFHCPTCQKLLRTADDKAGVRARCPGCGEVVTVPEASAAASFDDMFAGPAAREAALEFGAPAADTAASAPRAATPSAPPPPPTAPGEMKT